MALVRPGYGGSTAHDGEDVMLGRTAVAGLGAAVLLGAGGAGAMAFDDARDGPIPADMRKPEDDVGVELVDDDEGDGDGDGARDEMQTGTGTGTGDAATSTGSPDTATNSATESRAGTGTGSPDTATNTGTTSGGRAAAGGVRVSAGQLLINQRISQAALRRLAVVEALRANRPPPRARDRSDDGRRVTVSAAQLRINQRIAQAAVRRANALAGRPTPPRASSGRITLSARQLLINQRISQAAVRRANALLAGERR
ncbi:hypothetical protein [Miltoncostaea marina]|uniref:hypothetical protein n=1 Tax=Miltoncostaea marina TaxID=2843215 RepID=UPI001C3D26F7|nr:hypothetical protein [Miltoncostaea marina]